MNLISSPRAIITACKWKIAPSPNGQRYSRRFAEVRWLHGAAFRVIGVDPPLLTIRIGRFEVRMKSVLFEFRNLYASGLQILVHRFDVLNHQIELIVRNGFIFTSICEKKQMGSAAQFQDGHLLSGHDWAKSQTFEELATLRYVLDTSGDVANPDSRSWSRSCHFT